MNKNDYIKILREFQKDFKNEVNEDVIFFKECNYEERLEDISEQKNEYMCKAITYYMLLYILLQKDYKWNLWNNKFGEAYFSWLLW